jgi:hypothetical protein
MKRVIVIMKGRRTAHTDEESVVNMVGRVNRRWLIYHWRCLLLAMTDMIQALERQPQRGCLASKEMCDHLSPRAQPLVGYHR